jgi:hypothetical protein
MPAMSFARQSPRSCNLSRRHASSWSAKDSFATSKIGNVPKNSQKHRGLKSDLQPSMKTRVCEAERRDAEQAAAVKSQLDKRLNELEHDEANGTATDLDVTELHLLRKWKAANKMGMQLTSEDAAALRDIARTRARELAREAEE